VIRRGGIYKGAICLVSDLFVTALILLFRGTYVHLGLGQVLRVCKTS
jgi:hypothetical protein